MLLCGTDSCVDTSPDATILVVLIHQSIVTYPPYSHSLKFLLLLHSYHVTLYWLAPDPGIDFEWPLNLVLTSSDSWTTYRLWVALEPCIVIEWFLNLVLSLSGPWTKYCLWVTRESGIDFECFLKQVSSLNWSWIRYCLWVILEPVIVFE